MWQPKGTSHPGCLTGNQWILARINVEEISALVSVTEIAMPGVLLNGAEIKL